MACRDRRHAALCGQGHPDRRNGDVLDGRTITKHVLVTYPRHREALADPRIAPAAAARSEWVRWVAFQIAPAVILKAASFDHDLLAHTTTRRPSGPVEDAFQAENRCRAADLVDFWRFNAHYSITARTNSPTADHNDCGSHSMSTAGWKASSTRSPRSTSLDRRQPRYPRRRSCPTPSSGSRLLARCWSA